MTTDTVDMVRSGLAPEPQLIVEKFARLDQISADVQASFPYVQDVHGQRGFSSFSVEATVRYLHALWICDCKDMLLSVPITGRRMKGTNARYQRYEGQRALELLRDWQEEDSSGVVTFLELKLDYAPFGEITRAFEAAAKRGDGAFMRRLAHGRNVLLTRTQTLVRALKTIFALPSDRLFREVRAACAHYGHTFEQCTAQLAEMQTPLYSYVPHPALARRNMLLMNTLGVRVADNDADRPGRRTTFVQRPTMPQYAYAEHVVVGATTMVDAVPLEL